MIDHEKLLSTLIEIRSYSGGEDQLRFYIGDWFEEGGIPTIEQGPNLLVHIKGEDPTRCFILNSHMDTVSAGEIENWKYGPWTPTKEGNRIIGLGASDMKSGLAASILLADRLYKQRELPPVDLWFTYVAMEEIDGSGTASFAEWFTQTTYFERYNDMAGIFTEPTSLSEIEHGHRGNLFIQAVTYGDSGHASTPHLLSTHAVREMIKFSDTMQKAFEGWRKEFKSDIFEPPTVGELTSIQAGTDSPNKFPPSCTATFDVRATPDFYEVAFDRIRELGEKQGVEISLATPAAPAGYTDPSEKIVQIAMQAVTNPQLTVSQGSADLGFLSTKGIKAIILGPGEKDQCHVTNEFCYPAQIPEAVNIYDEIINGWSHTE